MVGISADLLAGSLAEALITGLKCLKLNKKLFYLGMYSNEKRKSSALFSLSHFSVILPFLQ